ncbi:DUF2336 domain-containing protein [Fulvimarina pelagi]|nr:DUF2336 domain-containing protein [Fulvimarina pelagi]
MMAPDTSATWCEPAAPSQRAEWAELLARAHLDGFTPEAERAEIDDILFGIAADPAVSVRRALAEAVAGAQNISPALIRQLARDADSVAASVIQSSPHMSEDELVEIYVAGRPKLREAVLGRAQLSESLTATIARFADAEDALRLLNHPDASLATETLRFIAETFGEEASIRGALVDRPDLSADIRQFLMRKTSEAVAASPLVSLALGESTGRSIGEGACQAGTATILGGARKSELVKLVERLAASEQLSPAVLLRLACSGSLEGLSEALAQLAGVQAVRVRSILVEGRNKPFAALCQRAGLPQASIAILFHAVDVWRHADEDGEMLTDGEVAARIMQNLAADLASTKAGTMAPALAFLRGIAREADSRRATQVSSAAIAAA